MNRSRMNMIARIKDRRVECACEALCLGLFMIVAILCAATLGHPASPLSGAVTHPLARRAIAGVAMGLTAIGLIYSPMGRRSGAHLNPATTITFARLGKISAPDACLYIVSQFAGGALGALAAAGLLRGAGGIRR